MEKNRIKYWRQQRELSQTDLAMKLETSQATISRMEKGELDLSSEWADKISGILDVHPLALWPWSFIARIQDEVELIDEEDNSYGMRRFRLLIEVLRALDRQQMPRGTEILASYHEDAPVSPAGLRMGDLVIARASSASNTGSGLVLRQVEGGGLLRTVGPGLTVSVGFDDPDLSFSVIGVVVNVLSRPSAREALQPTRKSSA